MWNWTWFLGAFVYVTPTSGRYFTAGFLFFRFTCKLRDVVEQKYRLWGFRLMAGTWRVWWGERQYEWLTPWAIVSNDREYYHNPFLWLSYPTHYAILYFKANNRTLTLEQIVRQRCTLRCLRRFNWGIYRYYASLTGFPKGELESSFRIVPYRRKDTPYSFAERYALGYK